MKRILFTLPISCLLSGCAVQQLALTTKQQIRSQNEIYIDQVQENLAALSVDRTMLPHFTLLQNGVPSVGDKGTVTVGSLTYPARDVWNQIHRARGGSLGPLGAERDVGSNWTITPVNDPDRLAAMRLLYLWILGKPVNIAEADELLKRYVGDHFTITKVPQGWFKCGGKHDVPENACRVFRIQKLHFWIAPGMEEQLTLSTLTVLAVATATPSPKPFQTIAWDYDPVNGTKLVRITRVIADPGPGQPTVIPRDPISFQKPSGQLSPGVVKGPGPQTTLLHLFRLVPQPSGEVTESPLAATPPAGADFVERVNNYSSQPLISPGLFSQPGMR